MAKVGDTVRYLSQTGGGVITKIDGKIAYVEEDGFETPVLIKELVVVLPAGHQPSATKAGLMFDQSAFDKGNAAVQAAGEIASKEVKTEQPAPAPAAPAPETNYGDKISLSLAFEPSDIRKLSEASFNAVLVNDSNYTILFTFSGRSADEQGWRVIYKGSVEPNELIDLASFTHQDLSRIERVAVQGVAFKENKVFSLESPVDASRRLDLTKFHKLHCFRPGRYFDDPVLEFPILDKGKPVRSVSESNPAAASDRDVEEAYADSLQKLKGKFSGKDAKPKQKRENPADNPHKLLPVIEVDLHIGELTDTTAGMSNADMLNMQLDTVRSTMKAHCKRIGQKIVFIHGKGEGVLRKAVISLLRKEFASCTLQDASFREYGFGATLVTVK